uniref:Uncharacterized protein n=1 Tax=Arundo donax TaxID=35708 RepID=A0A0A8YCJ3_ARUDO
MVGLPPCYSGWSYSSMVLWWLDCRFCVGAIVFILTLLLLSLLGDSHGASLCGNSGSGITASDCTIQMSTQIFPCILHIWGLKLRKIGHHVKMHMF